MTKPLGYYHLDYEQQLIQDIADTWGHNLQDLAEADRYWLIDEVAEKLFYRYSEAESDEAVECYERLDELDRRELDCLLSAIGNISRGQPLGYWGMPPESILGTPLIMDMLDTWDEALETMSEPDQLCLISHLAFRIWVTHCDRELNDKQALFELEERLGELPDHQLSCLLSALINK